MSDLIYEKKHTLLMRDCDMFGRLKPSAMLALFQDCSEDLTEGWGVGLDAMIARGVIWVAAKVGCTITRLPQHGETVTVRGWAARSRSGICPFRYFLEDESGAECASGVSMWVLSDLKTHSMMSDHIPAVKLPTPEPDDAKLPRFPSIRRPETQEHTPRRVQFSETDFNGHLTNTRYIDWLTDLAAPAFHRTHPVKGLRIDYRAETFPNEEIMLDWSLTEERLWCASDGRFSAELQF
ncbi:MAG: acyl-[acyl-carrier-protein] thioesterase [Oscillospiraceae bacterium]